MTIIHRTERHGGETVPSGHYDRHGDEFGVWQEEWEETKVEVVCPQCDSRRVKADWDTTKLDHAEHELSAYFGTHLQQEPQSPRYPEAPDQPAGFPEPRASGCFMQVAISAGVTFVIMLWALISQSPLVSCLALAGIGTTLVLIYLGFRVDPKETERWEAQRRVNEDIYKGQLSKYEAELQQYEQQNQDFQNQLREWQAQRERVRDTQECRRLTSAAENARQELLNHLSFRCLRCGCRFEHRWEEFRGWARGKNYDLESLGLGFDC